MREDGRAGLLTAYQDQDVGTWGMRLTRPDGSSMLVWWTPVGILRGEWRDSTALRWAQVEGLPTEVLNDLVAWLGAIGYTRRLLPAGRAA